MAPGVTIKKISARAISFGYNVPNRPRYRYVRSFSIYTVKKNTDRSVERNVRVGHV